MPNDSPGSVVNVDVFFPFPGRFHYVGGGVGGRRKPMQLNKTKAASDQVVKLTQQTL